MHRITGPRITITAYSDDRGSPEFAQSMTQYQAGAVRNYLLDREIPGARFRVFGMGRSRPMPVDPKVEADTESRWIEILLQPGG
jgi:outer membrane protein OmpA-like peptidoglycan-associated protein